MEAQTSPRSTPAKPARRPVKSVVSHSFQLVSSDEGTSLQIEVLVDPKVHAA